MGKGGADGDLGNFLPDLLCDGPRAERADIPDRRGALAFAVSCPRSFSTWRASAYRRSRTRTGRARHWAQRREGRRGTGVSIQFFYFNRVSGVVWRDRLSADALLRRVVLVRSWVCGVERPGRRNDCVRV